MNHYEIPEIEIVEISDVVTDTIGSLDGSVPEL